MKVAIMQPYFFPYIGYFQLINAVDVFVIYDDIEYVKQSWINRNRILVNGSPAYISVPLKKDSDYLWIKQRKLADIWPKESRKILQRIKSSYQKAPFFNETYEIVESALLGFHEVSSGSLFDFLFMVLQTVLKHLDVQTQMKASSELGDFSSLRSEEKVLAVCKELGATHYLNPIGGVELYDKPGFQEHGIELRFLKARALGYPQFNNEFCNYLSIIDVLMFNGKQVTQSMINKEYDLL